MEMNIKRIQECFREYVSEDNRRLWLDLSARPIQYGYNIFNSYRAGGKTANILIFCLIAYNLYNTTTMYLRSGNRATRAKAISTLCDILNNTVNDDGLNYVQQITDNRFCWIVYHTHTKTFRLLQSLDDEVNKCPVFIYVCAVNESLSLKSGFGDLNCNIILYDEFIDDETTNTSMIEYLNAISTVFRLRYKSIAFMNCNMSVGSPIILRKFGIYEKVLNQTTPYMVYHTKRGMKISVNILEPTQEQSNERLKMNETYFNFDTDIEGLENIRGTSVCRESYRELPDDVTDDVISETGLYIYSCGVWCNVKQVSSNTWQDMYYITECIEPSHDSEHLTITDDKQFSFDNPYTYCSIGKDFRVCVDLAKKVRRFDVCFDSFNAYIAVKSFYDFYKIPDLI